MDFDSLVGQIHQVQDILQAQAAHAVNLSLTARNWLVGYYIVEFEQEGVDRAKYGEKLLNRLAKSINRKGFEPRRLREYRQLYLVYPELCSPISSFLQDIEQNLSELFKLSIWRSAPAKLKHVESLSSKIWQAVTAKSREWATPAEKLFNRMNYTSLSYLSSIDDPLKRAFYEQEAIRGCWTSRELDHQVSTQYYERMGMSKDKMALHKLATKDSQQLTPRDIIHNPVTLEFLGLQSQEVFTETKLETAILNHLQHFLLEMGRGFCFESRQKRILVDQDYFKADLIFLPSHIEMSCYHRFKNRSLPT